MRIRDYDSRDDALASIAARHGLEPDDLDVIPAPGDDQDFVFVSFGPADDDVELARWPEEDSRQVVIEAYINCREVDELFRRGEGRS